MKRNCLVLSILTLALFAIVGHTQSASNPSLKLSQAGALGDESPALYLARVISVSPTSRDGFVTCLRLRELPVWQSLKRDGLLVDESVFEVTSVHTTNPGVPPWNFLLLSHLGPAVAPAAFLQAEKTREETHARGTRCEDAPGAEIRRVEVLRSTPNSYYPRPAPETGIRESTVEFFIEYIAVHDPPSNLNEYRESMRLNSGPAVGQLIRDKWMFNFIALETVSVEYAQPGMPSWNQIHIGGYFPEKGGSIDAAFDAAFDSALRRVNPEGGGFAGVFGRLDSIRTKPREDVARQLVQLAVR